MKHIVTVKRSAPVLLLALVLIISVGCTAPTPGLGTQLPGNEAGGAQSYTRGGSGGDDTPEAQELIDVSETPEPGEDVEFKGTIDSISGNTVVVEGQTLVVPAEMQSLLAQINPGDVVEIKAEFDSVGQLVLVEIKIEDGSDDNASTNENTNDNTDDNANLNANTNENTNENANENESNDNGDDHGNDNNDGDGNDGDDNGGSNSGGGGDDDDDDDD